MIPTVSFSSLSPAGIYLTDSYLFCTFAEYAYKHQTLIDDDQVTVEILDTAGQVKTIPLIPDWHYHTLSVCLAREALKREASGALFKTWLGGPG